MIWIVFTFLFVVNTLAWRGIMKAKTLLSFMICFLLLSCTNGPKEANKENFEKSVSVYLDKTYPKAFILVNLPYSTEKSISFNNIEEILSALADKGIVLQEEISRATIPAWYSDTGKDEIVIDYNYTLAEEGKKYYTENITTNVGGNPLGGFVFGKPTNVTVESFTEPVDFMGKRVSTVTYTYTLSDVPEWAKSAKLLEASSDVADEVNPKDGVIKRNDTLVLTDSGWVHQEIVE